MNADMYDFYVKEIGNRNGKPLVFLAGFPDDALSAWGKDIPLNLASDYRLLFVSFPSATISGDWGPSFPQLISMLHATFNQLELINDEQFVLLGHGIGSYLAILYQNLYPEHIERVILFDEGIRRTFLFSDMVYLFPYQWSLALAFIISRKFSKCIGNFLLFLLLWTPLCNVMTPFCQEHLRDSEVKQSVDDCYPFYYFWFAQFRKGSFLDARFPECPVLFIYGKKKKLRLHDEKFLILIRGRQFSRAVEIPKADYYPALSHPEIVTEEIVKFVS